MTVIAMIFGSFLGLISGVVGWLFLDFSALSAFALYLSISLGMTLTAALAQATQGDGAPAPQPSTLRG